MVQMELKKKLSVNNTVFDPKDEKNNDEFLKIAKKCLTTDIFMTSVNGLTEDGVIVNIDGTGNRVAGSLYGHKKVYYIVGKNKIMVSSRHSYKIPDNGIHSISALSNDGVIEAIENPYCDFNIGLQWHPELMGDDENSKKIFSKFIDAAEYNAYKKSKERKGR